MNPCMITQQTVKTIFEKRRREIHKGDCGRVLLVCGSSGMMGAAILACKGALRSGAGLVQLAVSETLFPIAQVAVPEATCLQRCFSTIDLGRYDAVAVGAGLGESEESIETVKYLLEKVNGPLVVDADGLNIIARQNLFGLLSARRARGWQTIITPHMGEAERLLTAGGANGKSDFRQAGIGGSPARLRIASALTEVTGAVAVLKGAGTVVATPEGEAYINTTGNPGMATGGSGDVLCGVIAGLWGQKKADGTRPAAAEAAVCGVFVHGLAGDLAAAELGEYGLVAGDIAGHLPQAMKIFQTEEKT